MSEKLSWLALMTLPNLCYNDANTGRAASIRAHFGACTHRYPPFAVPERPHHWVLCSVAAMGDLLSGKVRMASERQKTPLKPRCGVAQRGE